MFKGGDSISDYSVLFKLTLFGMQRDDRSHSARALSWVQARFKGSVQPSDLAAGEAGPQAAAFQSQTGDKDERQSAAGGALA